MRQIYRQQYANEIFIKITDFTCVHKDIFYLLYCAVCGKRTYRNRKWGGEREGVERGGGGGGGGGDGGGGGI